MPASGGSRFHASIENFTIIEIIVIIISCDEFGKFLKSVSDWFAMSVRINCNWISSIGRKRMYFD